MLPTAKSDSRVAVRTFDLIIFDLDGVIVDSVEDLVAALRHSLRQVGSRDCAFSDIRNLIGFGARNILLQSLDEDKKDRVDAAMTEFRDYYGQNCTNKTVLYPGVSEVLATYARHKKLALATFKIRAATLRILEALNVRDYFDAIVTADDVQRPKPDPECINRILQEVQCDPDAVLMVGDTPTDVQTARNAGVAACAVLYGIGTRENLGRANPDFLIDDIRELKNLVEP